MADKITLKYYKDGILTDPVSVVLEDRTNTYGIKRLIDDTVVVSPGTAVTREDVGVYSYDVSYLDKTYSYEYVFKVTLQGGVQYIEGYIEEETGITYTTLDDIRVVLTHATEGGNNLIRFSDSYINLGADSSNNGSISLSKVLISTDYSGFRDVEIEFTSSTDYKVSAFMGGYSQNLGSGSINNDFTTAPSWFRFLSADWSGTAQTGDKIKFSTNSHIATNGVIALARNAEVMVDSRLEEWFYNNSSLADELFFTSKSDVPKAIRVATTYLSCYLIWTSIYPIHNVLTRTQVDRNSDIDNWKKMAERLINSYIKQRLIGEKAATPQWYSREPVFDKIAVDFTEPQDDYEDIVNNNLGKFEINKSYKTWTSLHYHN